MIETKEIGPAANLNKRNTTITRLLENHDAIVISPIYSLFGAYSTVLIFMGYNF